MTNILILLCVLLFPYLGLLAANRTSGRMIIAPSAAGRISLALLLLVTGIAHFVQTADMARLLPDSVPSRLLLVQISGVIEILAGFALLLPRTQRLAGWFLVAYFILIFPANVYGAIHRVPFGGHELGPIYLLARAPLQLLFIWWAWHFAVRKPRRLDMHTGITADLARRRARQAQK